MIRSPQSTIVTRQMTALSQAKVSSFGIHPTQRPRMADSTSQGAPVKASSPKSVPPTFA